uniref:Uncharacterized protein n=1 Tax=Panagrolaimus sp. ES5 TaxID=591445 RepID=A0AC34G917_9BILA
MEQHQQPQSRSNNGHGQNRLVRKSIPPPLAMNSTTGYPFIHQTNGPTTSQSSTSDSVTPLTSTISAPADTYLSNHAFSLSLPSNEPFSAPAAMDDLTVDAQMAQEAAAYANLQHQLQLQHQAAAYANLQQQLQLQHRQQQRQQQQSLIDGEAMQIDDEDPSPASSSSTIKQQPSTSSKQQPLQQQQQQMPSQEDVFLDFSI